MKTLTPIVVAALLSCGFAACVGPKPMPAAGSTQDAVKFVPPPQDTTGVVIQPTPDAAFTEVAVDTGPTIVPVDSGPAVVLDTDSVFVTEDLPVVVGEDTAAPVIVPDVTQPVVVDVLPILDTAPVVVDIVWPTITSDAAPPIVKDVGTTSVPDTGPPKTKDIVAVVDAAPAIDAVPTVDVQPTPVDIAQPDAVDAGVKATPGLVYGMTLDAVGNLSAIVDSLKSLPVKPWVRIVFDYPLQPSDYAAAVAAIAPYAVIVGQPSDSTYNAQMTVAQYRARFQAYVDQLPQINIWETCNECNGDWLGPNASAQADAATDVVKAAGKKAMFTPYWNTSTCADKNGPYVAWISKNISSAVKTETDYVTPSIYGFDCDGPEPAYQELDAMVQTFADMFPNAYVGIGEYGKQGDATILKYYLGYPNPNPRYVFAGLYWYGKQDFVPKTQPLWTVFATGMK